MSPPRLAQMKAVKGVIVTDCSFRLNHQNKYYLSLPHFSPCCYFFLIQFDKWGFFQGVKEGMSWVPCTFKAHASVLSGFNAPCGLLQWHFSSFYNTPYKVCVAFIILLVDLVSFSVFLACSTACNSIKLFFWSFCFPELQTGIYGSL